MLLDRSIEPSLFTIDPNAEVQRMIYESFYPKEREMKLKKRNQDTEAVYTAVLLLFTKKSNAVVLLRGERSALLGRLPLYSCR